MKYFPGAYLAPTYFPTTYWGAVIIPPTVGTRVTRDTFMFKSKFSSLYTQVGIGSIAPEVDLAIAIIESTWSGSMMLWGTKKINPATREANRTLVENYLIAWLLADIHPGNTKGVAGDGGMVVTSKNIGGVAISRKDFEAQPAMKQLESNTFGIKALEMIMSAPERLKIYG